VSNQFCWHISANQPNWNLTKVTRNFFLFFPNKKETTFYFFAFSSLGFFFSFLFSFRPKILFVFWMREYVLHYNDRYRFRQPSMINEKLLTSPKLKTASDHRARVSRKTAIYRNSRSHHSFDCILKSGWTFLKLIYQNYWVYGFSKQLAFCAVHQGNLKERST